MGRTPKFVSDATAGRAEAARYALLRRLAPSMRHHLMVNLQPIGMLYEVIDRRLRSPQPDFPQMHASARKIHGFAHAALRSCLDVASWLAPEDDATTTAADGANECAGLLATGLSFRGYTLRNQVQPIEGQVRRSAVRNVLTATLVQRTDDVPPPVELVLSARATERVLAIELTIVPSQAEEGEPATPTYRLLEWADVEALAAAEGVELSRPDAARVVLGFPWVRAAQP